MGPKRRERGQQTGCHVLQIRFYKMVSTVLLVAFARAADAQPLFEASNLAQTAAAAEKTLEKAIDFYQSIAINGGYVYHYSLDLQQKWGEGPTGDHTVEVQSPGTPAVGMSYLRAYRVLDRDKFIEPAMDAAKALIEGQNELGGWGHVIHFDGPKSTYVSFDDNQTQGAMRFLMSLDLEVDDPQLRGAIERALDMMQEAQLPSGAWPHRHPAQGNYHDFATFNDGGINDCISVIMQAVEQYDTPELHGCLRKVGRFMELSQLPPPQPGWAQQYNDFLQPAWARAFEPPSVCTSVTLRNINTLLDMHLMTGENKYLELLPDAFLWLEGVRFADGTWPRFVEFYTNKPLYYDRGRVRVPHPDSLSLERRTGYGYIVDLEAPLKEAASRYGAILQLGADAYMAQLRQEPSREELKNRLIGLRQEVVGIIQSLDHRGRWVVIKDRYKKQDRGTLWAGEYMVQDRLSSALFNHNVARLCTFLELYKKLE